MPTPMLLLFLLGLCLVVIACDGSEAVYSGKVLRNMAVSESSSGPLVGPLSVSRQNPRYFSDPHGTIVYLTGSHTWANIQDFTKNGTAFKFDYSAHLADLKRYNHNVTRIWTWESSRTDSHTDIGPLAYARTGTGTALDGQPQFDLEQFNPVYFDRLRTRIAEAQEQGLYVMVMLFQGFSLGKKGIAPWSGHPYNAANNINGIDGDGDGDGTGHAVHTLALPQITELQHAYVRKMIDSLNEFDNVIWEISNESYSNATQWQYHLIDFIHAYEADKPKQHPVTMGVQRHPKDNALLFRSPAEAVAPGDGGYAHDPPGADGSKVVIADTDHLWGIGGSQEWVWISFVRGIQPIFMDPHDSSFLGNGFSWEDVRWSMGYTRFFANRMHLAAMTPQSHLASSGYCLANLGQEYLVYLPCQGIIGGRGCGLLRRWSGLSQQRGLDTASQLLGWNGAVDVDLSTATGVFYVEWFNPSTGKSIPAGTINAGMTHTFSAPFSGDAVLYLAAERRHTTRRTGRWDSIN